MPRRITKVDERSNPVYRSFIASFGVANIGKPPAADHLQRAAFLFARHGHNLTGVSPERAPIAGSA